MNKETNEMGKKKYLLLFLLMAIVAAAVGVCAFFYNRQQEAARTEAQAALQVQAEEGQEIRYLRVEEIIGNEVTAVETDENGAASGAEETGTEESGTEETGTEESGAEETGAEAGGETITFQIPVGTEVITRLGNSSSFSAITSGNSLAVLYEEGTENILKIWIQTQRPEGTVPEGETMPGDGQMPEGMELPDGMEMPSGQMQGGGDMPGGGNMPEGGDMPQGGGRP